MPTGQLLTIKKPNRRPTPRLSVNGRTVTNVRCWSITSIRGLIERADVKGNRTLLRNREDIRP
jgi:hypothetical protein